MINTALGSSYRTLSSTTYRTTANILFKSTKSYTYLALATWNLTITTVTIQVYHSSTQSSCHAPFLVSRSKPEILRT